MVDKVQAWQEYPEMRQILLEMVVYVKRMSKLLWEPSWRGNVSNNWKCNRNSPCFVITCIKYYDAE